MAKTIYIGIEDGMAYLETKEIDSNGVVCRKRTNSGKKIASYLDKEGKKFVDANLKSGNLILYTAGEVAIVMRDFDAVRKLPLFESFCKKVEQAPVVSNNLIHGKRASTLQILGLKFWYTNRTKLAFLALGGTVLMHGVPGMIDSIPNKSISEEAPTTVISMEESKEEEPEIVQIENLEVDFDFTSRLEQTKELQEQYESYDSSKIMLGARVDLQKMNEIVNGKLGETITNAANTYGVDPYLLIAKGLTESYLNHQECCPGGKSYNGYGVGAFQLESPDGRLVTAWNYKTESEDEIAVTMENALAFDKNAQIAAMYLQNRLNLYHNNIYLALQSYNYGQAMMKIVIHDYAKQKGITEKEVISNFNDLGWMEIVKGIHENPNDYYYRVTIDLDETDETVIANAKNNCVWSYKTYGNDHYVADVLSYYVGLKSKNKNLDDSSTVINLTNNEVMVLNENKDSLKVSF